MGSTRATDPQGGEWVVRRKWTHRRLRWRGRRGVGELLDGTDLTGLGSDLPFVGVFLVAIALLLLTFAAVLFIVPAVLFIVPAVLFVVELLIAMVIVDVGLTGRLLFGRPSTVEAKQLATGSTYQWNVSGWRPSRNLVTTIAEQLRATGLPTGGAPTPSQDT